MMKWIILFFGFIAIANGSNLAGRIISGFPSASDDAYAVAVFSAKTPPNLPLPPSTRLSTGVAISNHIVVVVAQAIYGFTNWRIGVDSHNREQQISSEVAFSSHHPQYDPVTLENNVGVLRVSILIESYLPLGSSIPGFPVLFAIGFGHTSSDEDASLPNISHQSAVHVYSYNVCRPDFNQRIVRSTNICGETISKFGNGDQGAPLVDFGRNYVYGITSFWDTFSEDGNPMVATDLTHDYIRAYLNEFL